MRPGVPEKLNVFGGLGVRRLCGRSGLILTMELKRLYPRSAVRALSAFALAVLMPLALANANGTVPQPSNTAAEQKGPLPGETDPQDASSPARVRLISQEQYFNSLAYIF